MPAGGAGEAAAAGAGCPSRALCPPRRDAGWDWSRWKATLGRGKHRLLYSFSEDGKGT